MSLIDPQVVTVNAVAKSMPRILTSGTSAKYQMADETFSLSLSHTKTKDQRIRSMARIDQRAIIADPLNSEKFDYDVLSYYSVIDRPDYGFTLTQVQQLITGYKTWLTDAMVEALFGQQS